MRAGTSAHMVQHAWHIRHGDGERLRLEVWHGVVVAGLQHIADLPHSCNKMCLSMAVAGSTWLNAGQADSMQLECSMALSSLSNHIVPAM